MTKNAHLDSSVESISRWQTPNLLDDENSLENSAHNDDEYQKQVYEKSYKEGYQAGLDAANEEIESQLEVLKTLTTLLSEPFSDMNENIVKSLADISGKIARTLVKRELKTEPETIMAIVRDSILALGETESPVSVYLHPEDAEVLRSINSRMTDKMLWNVIEDPLLTRGDCKVSTEKSLIDENIQSRINLIITRFLGDERQEHSYE